MSADPGARVLLTTDRLRLRRLVAADASNLFELDNDPDVMRYLNGGVPTPMDVIRDEIMPAFLAYDDDAPCLGVWGADERETGDFAGWFCLLPTGTPGEAGLGFRLCRRVWGRGYATEGSSALLREAFVALHLARVVATTYEENAASRRVLEKLGMREVRRFRYTPEELSNVGSYHNPEAEVWPGQDIEYAITRDAWEKRG